MLCSDAPPSKTSFANFTIAALQLIQPITQSSGVDSAVQGLCAFLLGICYEYNREPGPITRCVTIIAPPFPNLLTSG